MRFTLSQEYGRQSGRGGRYRGSPRPQEASCRCPPLPAVTPSRNGCSRRCPRATTGWPRSSPFGQNAALAAGHGRPIVPAPGQRILDVASGTAGVALQLARRTGAAVVGVDLTEQMLAEGHRRVAGARPGRPDRPGGRAGRAAALPRPVVRLADLHLPAALRADPQATLAELARVVRPGARVASLEFCCRPSRCSASRWWLYTRLVLPAGGLPDRRPGVDDVGPVPRAQHFSGHYRRYPVSGPCGPGAGRASSMSATRS